MCSDRSCIYVLESIYVYVLTDVYMCNLWNVISVCMRVCVKLRDSNYFSDCISVQKTRTIAHTHTRVIYWHNTFAGNC